MDNSLDDVRVFYLFRSILGFSLFFGFLRQNFELARSTSITTPFFLLYFLEYLRQCNGARGSVKGKYFRLPFLIPDEFRQKRPHRQILFFRPKLRRLGWGSSLLLIQRNFYNFLFVLPPAPIPARSSSFHVTHELERGSFSPSSTLPSL